MFTNLPVGTHIYAAVDVYGNSGTVNFGQTKFKYAAPAGFKSLCSTNLPTPAISKPSNHVDAKPYAGNNTSNEQQLGFTPDILITKKRSAGNAAGVVFDSIRGATKAIETSNASLEKTNRSCYWIFRCWMKVIMVFLLLEHMVKQMPVELTMRRGFGMLERQLIQ